VNSTAAPPWLQLQPLQPLPKSGPAPEDVWVRERGAITEEHDPDDRERLEALIAELHLLAERLMRGQPNGTLQPTALVNEAYLKLYGNDAFANGERAIVLATAGKTMRHILVDRARAKRRLKREAPGERVPLDGVDGVVVQFEQRAVDILALEEVLEQLGTFDAEMARTVDLTFYGGLSQEEAAQLLGIPLRTFERRWEAARAWLRAKLR
jgi:RNA polymerase sigma factor (TIGR02999 family)